MEEPIIVAVDITFPPSGGCQVEEAHLEDGAPGAEAAAAGVLADLEEEALEAVVQGEAGKLSPTPFLDAIPEFLHRQTLFVATVL